MSLAADKPETAKIRKIALKGAKKLPAKHLLKRDRNLALKDLLTENHFAPVNDDHGPYTVEISIEENRLVFRMQNAEGADLPMLVLSPKPYKRLIQDYFLIVNSYGDAVNEGKPSKIEAIDQGRRGLHNEGAALLMERLEDKIEMDLKTARRIFTLICVLHAGVGTMWRS